MKPLLSDDELARYARAIVKVGLGIGAGDDLVVTCQPAHRELAVALVEQAYKARARSVEVDYVDPYVREAHLRTAPEKSLGYQTPWRLARMRATAKPETATLLIAGESEPGVLDRIKPQRLATDMTRPLEEHPEIRRLWRQGRRRWAIVAWPAPAWAEQVYPEKSSEAAQRQLAKDLLWFLRVGPQDPADASKLKADLDAIQKRADRLTRLRLERVELRGPGTNLSVALHPETVWAGGGDKNFYGKKTTPNLPTEENFTSPEAGATEGFFRCTLPLMFQGRVIDGIAGEFRNGRLVRLAAKRKADRDFLAGLLFKIDGADRLGEVALVDRTSRIGQRKRIYYNTLLDENAAAHMAFGSGFQNTRTDHQTNRARRGVNRSHFHLDVMIGSDDFEATGIGKRGRRVPLIQNGVWQI